MTMKRMAREQQSPERRLRDLAGVGTRVEANLHRLGVHAVLTLAGQEGDDLYRRLGAIARRSAFAGEE